MRFTETALSGAWLIEPTPVWDDRGSFQRTFSEKEFAGYGLVTSFVQHSHSHSVLKGTLHGLHFQEAPFGEVKVVSCTQGAIFDVIVDFRPGSPTRYRWLAFELTPGNQKQVYVPHGFAHGYQTLADDTVVSYLVSQFNTPHAFRGIRYNDPALAIEWPLEATAISEKDRTWPLLG
jgi:dTDP-4-dehydrorhamnose 3,5-epimerase